MRARPSEARRSTAPQRYGDPPRRRTEPRDTRRRTGPAPYRRTRGLGPQETDGDTSSMATRTDPQPPAPHAADSHDLIRVHGARENNLKDVSVEIPKRRLTVFTGVSGSGKSSLVFDTIAAESQRLINETYSAFVQGFMPTLARPEVDVLDGLTTAIIVDQQRHGRRPALHRRHRHRRQRDAAHPLQPPRQAAHRLAQGVLLQRRLDQRGGRGHRGARRAEGEGAAQLQHHRRHVSPLRGPGRRSPTSTSPSSTTTPSRSREGAITVPGYTGGGWNSRALQRVGLLRPGQADPQSSPRRSCRTSSTVSRPG